MTDYIVFPDVEKAIIAYLDGLFTIPVAGRVPTPRPPAFIRVEVTGGDQPSLVVDEPLVLVESWAQNDADASDWAQKARAALRVIGQVGDATFYRTRVVSRPQNLPDPTTKQARSTALYAIRVRGKGVTTL